MVISAKQGKGFSLLQFCSVFPALKLNAWHTHAHTHTIIDVCTKNIPGKVKNSCCLYPKTFWKLHCNTEELAIVDWPA